MFTRTQDVGTAQNAQDKLDTEIFTLRYTNIWVRDKAGVTEGLLCFTERKELAKYGDLKRRTESLVLTSTEVATSFPPPTSLYWLSLISKIVLLADSFILKIMIIHRHLPFLWQNRSMLATSGSPWCPSEETQHRGQR